MEEAKIYTFSILYFTTAQYSHLVPYVTAILEFENGRRLPVLLEGYVEGNEVRIGQIVKYAGEIEAGGY